MADPNGYLQRADIASSTASAILSPDRSFLSATASWAVATTAETIGTLWNSVVPSALEINTADLLRNVDKDAAALLEQDDSSVHLASMIAGSFVPAGVGMKLINMARGGLTQLGYNSSRIGASWVGTRQEFLRSEMKAALDISGPATAQYKSLTRQLYASHFSQQMLDNAILGVAVSASMNAHPWMEDFWEDPSKKLALDAVGGGSILGTALFLGGSALFALPAAIAASRGVRALAETSAYKTILDNTEFQFTNEAFTNAAKYQSHKLNIERLDKYIGDPSQPFQVREVAQSIKYLEGQRMAESVLDAAPWTQALKEDTAVIREQKDTLRKYIVDILSDDKMIGVNKIARPNLDRMGQLTSANLTFIKGPTNFTPELAKSNVRYFAYQNGDSIALTTDLNHAKRVSGENVQYVDMPKKLAPSESVLFEPPEMLVKGLKPYSQPQKGVVSENLVDDKGRPIAVMIRLSTGETFASSGARNAATAADIPNIGTLINNAKKKGGVNLVAPTKGWGENALVRQMPAAREDAEFAFELAAIGNLPKDQHQFITVAPDHLPRLNALLSYADTLPPAERAALRIKVTDQYPTFAAQKAFVEKTVSPTYWDDVSRLVESERFALKNTLNPNDPYGPQIDNAITGYIHGTAGKSIGSWIADWRAAATNAMHSTQSKTRGDMDTVFRKVWEAGAGFRAEMRKLADPDGYVYLYRTLKTSEAPTSHATVESYTIKRGLATIAGEQRLFKVHTDNIIGSFGVGRLKEYEILVTSPHNQVVDNIPVSTGKNSEVIIDAVDDRLGADDLLGLYADATQRHIKTMINEKIFSPEEISARTNVKRDAVLAVMAGGHLKDLQTPWRRYTDASKLEEYISPANRLWAAQGDNIKNHAARAYSNLDRMQTNQMKQMELHQFTRASQSDIANKLLDNAEEWRIPIEQLENEIVEIANATVSRPTFQSADQVVRKLKNGATITALGKQFSNTVDTITKTLVVDTMAAPLLAVRNNQTALLEFNATVNKLYSLAGWRDIQLDEVTQKWMIVTKDDKGIITPITRADGTPWYIQQDEVAHALNSTRKAATQTLLTQNLIRKTKGQAPLNDLGLYLPPINIVEHNYAFVIDRVNGAKTQLLVANTAAELETQITAYSRANNVYEKGIQILRKGDQEADSLARSYSGGNMHVTYADVSQQHTGVASLAILPSDARLISNIISGYQYSILQNAREFQKLSLRGVTDWLDNLSYYNQRNVRDQPKPGLSKDRVEDAAKTVSNILLGRSQTEQVPFLKAANNITEFLINGASRVVDTSWSSLAKDPRLHKDHFTKLEQELKAIGINEPLFQSFDLYQASLIPEARNVAPSIISAGNGLVATMGIRLFEAANAAVNLMSLPILSWSSLMEKLPATALSNGQSVKLPLRLSYDSMRWLNSPQAKSVIARWETSGHIDQVMRQFDELTSLMKNAGTSTNATERAANALSEFTNSKVVGALSIASDWTEKYTRKFAMAQGYLGAKRAYPGISEAGADIAALAFADRIVGNYHAAQRPGIFQGTMGAAIGLYQTYMVTYAQNIYRGLENKNLKQLSTLMLTQAGIFGMKSLPGYNLLSEHVVSELNNNNWDLTTGAYRNLDNPLAEMILYGMPSSITGAAFYTRGETTPRIPSTTMDLALLNSARQGYELISTMADKIGKGVQDGTVTQGILESLSLQSINRPIARWAELLNGQSITRQGNTVSTQDEVWTPLSVGARALGTRPVQEQVVREAIHLNRFYEARDHDNRQSAVIRLKTQLRTGELDDDTVGSVADAYLRNGGNAKGWQQVLNQVLAQNEGARLDLLDKLEPTSPLNVMIREMY